MIEIIKRGTKKTHTCNNCGCVFSYEDEDVECDSKAFSFVNGIQRNVWEYSVKCPQCEEEIVLKNYR